MQYFCERHDASDVYVVAYGSAGYHCCNCRLAPAFASGRRQDVKIASPRDMAEHLEAHRELGDRVPAGAILQLQREWGDWLVAHRDVRRGSLV